MHAMGGDAHTWLPYRLAMCLRIISRFRASLMGTHRRGGSE